MEEELSSRYELYRGKIPGGVLGEKEIRKKAKTAILGKLSQEQILKGSLSIDEINDLIHYLGWNVWDMLIMRATEGESGLIPRQEYETLGIIQDFFRYPTFVEAITEKVGPRGVIGLGQTGKREIGTKINLVHNWGSGVTSILGRAVLEKLGWIKPQDYIKEVNTCLLFGLRLMWGYRGDGYIFSSQNGYRSPILDSCWIDKFQRELETLDSGNNREIFRQLNATTELLGFLSHFDCRAGLGDTGPYDLGNGKMMIVRDHFLKEDIYHWCDVCEDLPYAVTLAFVIDSESMGLKEIRVSDISTTFTWPRNYHPYITSACFYIRPHWNTPVEEIERLSYSDAPDLTNKAKEVTLRLYKKISRMSRRQLIINGLYCYYVGIILPYARLAGIYDIFCKDYDLWELDSRVSRAYYRIQENDFAREVIPQYILAGAGYPEIPSLYYW